MTTALSGLPFAAPLGCATLASRPAEGKVHALRKDLDNGVRLACALYFVAHEPDASASEILELSLANELSPVVRAVLVKALGRIDESHGDTP